MKKLILALALMPCAAMADEMGMAMRMNCGTFVDLAIGDVETTVRVNAYMKGLIDGVAISNGIAIPGDLPNATRRIIVICRENPKMSVARALATHVDETTFE